MLTMQNKHRYVGNISRISYFDMPFQEPKLKKTLSRVFQHSSERKKNEKVSDQRYSMSQIQQFLIIIIAVHSGQVVHGSLYSF